MSEIELSIVMPCLNEAKTLPICIAKAQRYLESAGICGEVIIADNGSTDGSVEVAEATGALVVEVPERGYGSALRAGIAYAKGTYVIMGDADDSYDFSALEPFVTELRRGTQLVMGNRFKGGIKPGAMPLLHRYLGNPVLSFIGRLFFSNKGESRIGDFHCGLRGFHRASIRKLGLRSTGMEFASEMVVKASLANLTMSEVPTVLHPDGRDRAPHLNTWRDGWRHLRFLLIFSPKWMFFYPGLLAFVVGLVFSFILVLTPINIGAAILDIQTLLYSAALTVVGLQMIFFSTIVQLIGIGFGNFPNHHRPNWLLGVFTLERGLVFGLLLILLGLAWTGSALMVWREVNFSELDPRTAMRQTIPAVTMVIIGAQTVLHSFVISAIQMFRP
ncbi:MAG: glycosyltransferase family 2 protein [Pseudomonadales bacterium]